MSTHFGNAGSLTLLPEGLSDQAPIAGPRLMYLTERVRDDGLRSALNELRAAGARIETTRSMRGKDITEHELDAELGDLMRLAHDVQERLGVVLRSIL